MEEIIFKKYKSSRSNYKVIKQFMSNTNTHTHQHTHKHTSTDTHIYIHTHKHTDVCIYNKTMYNHINY